MTCWGRVEASVLFGGVRSAAALISLFFLSRIASFDATLMFVPILQSSGSGNLHGAPRRLHDAAPTWGHLGVASIQGRVRHTAVYHYLLRSRARLSYYSYYLHSPRCRSVPQSFRSQEYTLLFLFSGWEMPEKYPLASRLSIR